MRKFLAILAALSLGACASPQLAPRFTPTNLAPVEQSQKEVETHAKKARAISKDIQQDCPQAQALIDQLNAEIDGLLQANAQGQGALAQAKTEIKAQTDKANNLATAYDKQGVTIKAKDEAIHRRNKILAMLFVLNLACLAWIFRRPLLALVAA